MPGQLGPPRTQLQPGLRNRNKRFLFLILRQTPSQLLPLSLVQLLLPDDEWVTLEPSSPAVKEPPKLNSLLSTTSASLRPTHPLRWADAWSAPGPSTTTRKKKKCAV